MVLSEWAMTIILEAGWLIVFYAKQTLLLLIVWTSIANNDKLPIVYDQHNSFIANDY